MLIDEQTFLKILPHAYNYS